MAEEEKVEDNAAAEETLMSLGGGAEPGLGGGAEPRLSDVQIIACAVIGATTGNATEGELEALYGTRPGLAAALEARGGSSSLENLGDDLRVTRTR